MPHALHENSNQIEWDLYHEMNDDVREMMATPYAISDNGRVLAMEEMACVLNNMRDFDFATREKMLTEFNATLCERLRESGMSDTRIDDLTSDNHADNVAFDHKGCLRWIDYGTDRVCSGDLSIYL